jgi:O-antigen biosynthesis protein
VLYHWRKLPGSVAADIDAKESVPQRQVAAVNAHLQRCQIRAVARSHPTTPHRVQLHPEPRSDWPLVSVVLAGEHRAALLRSLESIFEVTDYPRFEVILVGGADANGFPGKPRMKRVSLDGQFTVPRAVNVAEKAASGDVLVLIEDGVVVLTPQWLQALVWPLETPGIGAVGPVLTTPDLTVRSAGVVLSSRNGPLEDALTGLRKDADGHAGSLSCMREVSSIRGPGMALTRRTFVEHCGFREDYRVSGYDVDLCLRLRRAGDRVLCTPQAVLAVEASLHAQDSFDSALLSDVWADVLARGDPYYRSELARSM